MRLSKEILATLSVVCLTSGIAMASTQTADVQAYAHPTLFSAQGHSLLTGDTDLVTTGAKIYKPCNAKTITGKENVVIGREAKKLLNDMKSKMDTSRANAYDPKMPVLRSEIAYIISTGLGLTNSVPNKYTDLDAEYWAKEEIDRALAADVMIGYPDNTFKPDQAITKAEVFATFAKMMVVDHDATATPVFNGQTVKYIPNWAIGCTNEVLASGILNSVPNKDKIINDEYLSKEQVSYMLNAMKASFNINTSNGAVGCATLYGQTAVKVKLSERISARTSTVGDTFTAKTTEDVVINGQSFPAGSTVKGIVTAVARPGVKNPGYIEVKFQEIKNGDCKVEFPNQAANANLDVKKNPNIISRVLGSPVAMIGRTAGVAGRTVSTTAEVVSNGTEEVVGNLSDALSDTASLHPLKGLKDVSSGVIAVGKGATNVVKTTTTGVFGVCYEIVDEFKYIIVPNTANDSSLNPDEELTIVF
jgi:hypothetical protein